MYKHLNLTYAPARVLHAVLPPSRHSVVDGNVIFWLSMAFASAVTSSFFSLLASFSSKESREDPPVFAINRERKQINQRVRRMYVSTFFFYCILYSGEFFDVRWNDAGGSGKAEVVVLAHRSRVEIHTCIYLTDMTSSQRFSLKAIHETLKVIHDRRFSSEWYTYIWVLRCLQPCYVMKFQPCGRFGYNIHSYKNPSNQNENYLSGRRPSSFCH